MVEQNTQPSEDSARSMERPFGQPGAPLRRTPFLFGLAGTAGVLVTLIGFAALRTVAEILALVFVAMFLAIGLNRPVAAMVRHGIRRGLAVLIMVVVALLVLCGGAATLVPLVAEQAEALLDALPGFLHDLAASPALSDVDRRDKLTHALTQVLTPQRLTDLAGGVLGAVGSVLGALGNIAIIAVLSLFFLAAYDGIRAGGYGLVPRSRRERVMLLGDAIVSKVGAYLMGSLLIACIAGAVTAAWALLLGIPYAVLMALIVAVLDMIPQIGATIGAVIVCLVALSVSWPVALASAVFFLVYQQTENWLIYPRVMHQALHVSNLAAILSVLIGGSLLGVFGVLVAVPTFAAVQLIVREVVMPRQDTR